MKLRVIMLVCSLLHFFGIAVCTCVFKIFKIPMNKTKLRKMERDEGMTFMKIRRDERADTFEANPRLYALRCFEAERANPVLNNLLK